MTDNETVRALEDDPDAMYDEMQRRGRERDLAHRRVLELETINAELIAALKMALEPFDNDSTERERRRHIVRALLAKAETL